jgi:hypothetical protein
VPQKKEEEELTCNKDPESESGKSQMLKDYNTNSVSPSGGVKLSAYFFCPEDGCDMFLRNVV